MYKRQGIGALYNKDDRQAEDATTGISARSFSNISSSLSTVYKNDDGIYGNNGYPVLVWQEAVDESEKVYMEEIPEDVQRELDAYQMCIRDRLRTVSESQDRRMRQDIYQDRCLR